MTSRREDSLLDEISRLRAEINQLQSASNSSQLALSYVLKRFPKFQVQIPIEDLLAEDGFIERDWDDAKRIVTYRLPKKERVR